MGKKSPKGCPLFPGWAKATEGKTVKEVVAELRKDGDAVCVKSTTEQS